MRASVTVLGCALMAHLAVGAEDSTFTDALRGGLGWYFRWMQEVPVGAESIDCRIAIAEARGFACCSPGSIYMDIDVVGGAQPRVINIRRDMAGFERELWRLRGGVRLESLAVRYSVRSVSIAARDLGSCKIDRDLTAQAPAMALPAGQRPGSEMRLGRKYPVVCEGDPLYLIYFMQGTRVEWIWQFRLRPQGADLAWSYEAGSSQRKIPERAARNLARSDLWFKEEPPEEE